MPKILSQSSPNPSLRPSPRARRGSSSPEGTKYGSEELVIISGREKGTDHLLGKTEVETCEVCESGNSQVEMKDVIAVRR